MTVWCRLLFPEPLLNRDPCLGKQLFQEPLTDIGAVGVGHLYHAPLTFHELRVVSGPLIWAREAQFSKPLDQLVALRLFRELAHGLRGSVLTVEVDVADDRDL
jgi:hypothetical protein